MHIQGLTSPGELISLFRFMFPFHQGKAYISSHCSAGRNRDDPRNKWFGQLPGTSPKSPLPEAREAQTAGSSPPSRTSPWPMALLGKSQEPAVSREYSLTLGTKNLLAKVSPAALCSKANKEARLVERKGWLYFRGQQ